MSLITSIGTVAAQAHGAILESCCPLEMAIIDGKKVFYVIDSYKKCLVIVIFLQYYWPVYVARVDNMLASGAWIHSFK